MKRLLFLLSFILLIGCSAKQHDSPTKETSLSAVILSDLHYMEEKETENTYLPLTSRMPELTETITREVIDIHPDVLIMTGDNTNNGKNEEITQLKTYLQRIKDAGIQVIMITGNHDMYGDHAFYKDTFFPLFNITDEDKETMSYVSVINDVRIIAMDDSSTTDGKGGFFPKSTMQWLEKQLSQANREQQKIIFLSHYSILTGLGTDGWDNYRIQNPDLLPLLEKYHVKLAFTGHQHSQVLLQNKDLYELIGATPTSFPCLFGNLTIEGDEVSYHAEAIDFETYAPGNFYHEVVDMQERASRMQSELFTSILSEKIENPNQLDATLQLLNRFFTAFGSGTLGSVQKQIINDPSYPLLMEGLEDTNYGSWIKELMKSDILNAGAFTFTYE